MFEGPQFGSSQPKAPKQPMMPGQRPPHRSRSLISVPFSAPWCWPTVDQIAWSDFNPSNQFRNVWPRNLVWSYRAKNGIKDADFLRGIDTLLFPWPGILTVDENKSSEIVVKPLALATSGSVWGTHQYDEFISWPLRSAINSRNDIRHCRVMHTSSRWRSRAKWHMPRTIGVFTRTRRESHAGPAEVIFQVISGSF